MNAPAHVYIDGFCSVRVVTSSDCRGEVRSARSGRKRSDQSEIMVRMRTIDLTARTGERRSIERRWLYRSALLSNPGQIVAQECRLRDYTVKGAGIRLNGITLFPLTLGCRLMPFTLPNGVG
jgi:hypothetical protein